MKETYSLLISDEANADILDGYLWYELAREGLGKDFELCLEAEFNRLLRNPPPISGTIQENTSGIY
jgi:hypothetical protein